jgi:SAM-dependent methyltransferase
VDALESQNVFSETLQASDVLEVNGKKIKIYDDLGQNIDSKTVQSFGDEWKAFHSFSNEDLTRLGDMYFDIVTEEMVGSQKTAIDFGCGSGRWSRYISKRFGAIAAVDPSEAIFAASKVLKDAPNVHLYKASIDNLPFKDGSFDFGFSLGVLHHIPDTAKAMQDCVRKIKPGGYFLVYLYYNLDNKGWVYKSVFHLSNLLRKGISKLPSSPKKAVCSFLAVTLYLPFVSISRIAKKIGVAQKYRQHIPLHGYENTSFYIMKNDALDRFGTPLEQRFSKTQIEKMMIGAGLTDIVFSTSIPYWHAVGKKRGVSKEL